MVAAVSFFTFEAPSKDQLQLVRNPEQLQALLNSYGAAALLVCRLCLPGLAGNNPEEADASFYQGPLKGVDMDKIFDD